MTLTELHTSLCFVRTAVPLNSAHSVSPGEEVWTNFGPQECHRKEKEPSIWATEVSFQIFQILGKTLCNTMQWFSATSTLTSPHTFSHYLGRVARSSRYSIALHTPCKDQNRARWLCCSNKLSFKNVKKKGSRKSIYYIEKVQRAIMNYYKENTCNCSNNFSSKLHTF